jgi:hypothetical protein
MDTQEQHRTSQHAGPHPIGPTVVTITLDGNQREIPGGRYTVKELKNKLGIDPSYELEVVIDRRLTPIDDCEFVEVHGCEIFLSHPRCGASS